MDEEASMIYHDNAHYIKGYLKWPSTRLLNHCYTWCENKEQKNVNRYEGNDREKRYVLRRFRKTVSVGADVTSGGKLLQRRLPATRNERSLT